MAIYLTIINNNYESQSNADAIVNFAFKKPILHTLEA